MNNQIKSEKLVIKEVFERWYKIPSYQRPYVWEKDQITDLLDDISYAQIQNEKAEYFLGSIVFQTKKNSDGEYIEDDLLDGQQRLTTLFLLIATIRDLTANPILKDTCKSIIFQTANEFSGTPERLRIIFDIREDVREFVNSFIKIEGGTLQREKLEKEQKTSDDLSIKNISNAILVIQEYFADTNCPISIEDFFKYLNNKVIMIYVSSESLEDAFRMFTILNSRGVKLRNSDILKAENLRLIPSETQKKYAKFWEQTENFFKEDFDVFLSHIRTILVKDKARLNLYDEFEKNIYSPKKYFKEEKTYINLPPLLKKGEDTFKFIGRYKEHYISIFNKEHYSIFGNYKFDNLISIMQNVLPADFWIPPLLRYYDKFGEQRLLEFTEKLDNKFSFDWITGLSPTFRIDNMNSIIKLIDETDDSNVDEVFINEIFNIDVDNLINIVSDDIYGRRYARYILYKLDYFYSGTDKMHVPQIISVEHILPQNPKDDSQWKIDFSDEERKIWTNKIGNLVLISRRKNSAQGRVDFQLKKSKYFSKDIELFRNSVRIFNNKHFWTVEALATNHNEVLNKIKSHYNQNNNL